MRRRLIRLKKRHLGAKERRQAENDKRQAHEAPAESQLPLSPESCKDLGTGEVIAAGQQTRPANHHFSLVVIAIGILTVIEGAVALRATERTIDIHMRLRGGPGQAPSHSSIRLWLLRLGHYKLHRSKERAADWVFILDHSVQQGKVKCLFVVGLRLSQLKDRMKLTHRDVEPLALVPMTRSNGPAVAKVLRRVARQTGVPRQIVADDGGDLRAGIAMFRTKHKAVDTVYDIKHKVACELRRVLGKCRSWERFCKQVNAFKRAVQQTDLAPLTPPAQRSKARYMNIDVLLSWAVDIGIPAFQYPQRIAKELGVDQQLIAQNMRWLGKYPKRVAAWHEVCVIAQAFETVVRNEGYHSATLDIIDRLVPDANTPQAKIIHRRLRVFVQEQVQKARPGETLLGASEVLESIFGTLKRLEAGHAKEGFTSFVLSAAAVTGPIDPPLIKTALEATRTKVVRRWAVKALGRTVQGARRALREVGAKLRGERKPDQLTA